MKTYRLIVKFAGITWVGTVSGIREARRVKKALLTAPDGSYPAVLYSIEVWDRKTSSYVRTEEV